MRRGIGWTVVLAVSSVCLGTAAANRTDAVVEGTAVPLYKPSSNSPVAMNILAPGYGGSRQAPNAIALGTIAPDFTLPRAGGGQVSLVEVLSSGPAVIIFYRGHW